MKVVIDISDEEYENVKKANGCYYDFGKAIVNGTVLPKGHGRLIDADRTLNNAWKKFYEQEDKHEKNIDDYDLTRDRFYEQSGFECCQQALVSAPTIIEADKAESEE